MSAGAIRALAAALVAASSACLVEHPPGEPTGAPEPRPGRAARPIVDGTLAPGDPAVVAIGSRRVGCDQLLDARCTGTLIAPRLVLTAAHCVIDPRLRLDLEVMFGADVGAPDAAFHRVVDVAVHPDYRADGGEAGLEADLAVLVLDAPAAVPPVGLPRRPLDAALVGQDVRIVGFGETGPTGQPPGIKRAGTATVSQLADAWFRIEPGPSMSCHGDSGGPVLGMQDGVELLLGVASRGDPGCAIYGVNVRVDRFAREFIEPWIAEAAALPPIVPPLDDAAIPGSQLCTAACARDAECQEGMVCRPGLDGDNRCVIPGLVPGDLGEICNRDDMCNERCVRLRPDREEGSCRCHRACSDAPAPVAASGCAAAPGGQERNRLWMMIALLTLVLRWNRNQVNPCS